MGARAVNLTRAVPSVLLPRSTYIYDLLKFMYIVHNDMNNMNSNNLIPSL